MTPILPTGYTHGTSRAYRHCKPACDSCRAANTAAQRERHERRLAAPIPDEAHGKPSTYSDRGCRCRRCKTAYRAWSKTRPARLPKAAVDVADMPDSDHGTWRGYTRWKCKCEPCRQAGRDHRDAKKLKQRGHEPQGPTEFRGYRYRIQPTPQVAQALDDLFRGCRFVYNQYVALCRTAHDSGEPHPSEFAAVKTLVTDARKSEPTAWLGSFASNVLASTVRDGDRAYQNFFDSVAGRRKGPRIGAPRFRRYTDEQNARFPDGSFTIRGGWTNTQRGGGRLYLAKIGHVHVDWYRPLPSLPSSVTISRDPDGTWHASFTVKVETETAPGVDGAGRIVGIDLGLADYAALVYSDGTREKVAAPKYYRAAERKLARANQALARTKKHSRNHEKARAEVARIHQRVVDLRTNFSRQLAARLVRDNQVICMEDLNIAGMVADGHTERRKSIHDVAWATFRRDLLTAAERAGREIVLAPRYFPGTQTCAVCGHRGGKILTDIRQWTCGCGAVLDRDYNAATNHLMLARGSVESLNACGSSRAQLAGPEDESGTAPCGEEPA